MIGRAKSAEGLVLGGVPRVHLLPPEVEGQRKVRAFRRSLLTGLAASVIVVILAIAATSLLLTSAVAQQADEQARGLLLATQLKKYSAVTGVQAQVDAITAAQPVAVQGEILWAPFVATLQASLPAGTSITSFTAKLDQAGTDAATNPLLGAHVATLSVTAEGPQDILTTWLGQLTTLKGVVNSNPGAVAISPDPGLYVVNVDLLIGTDVIADRFKTGK